MTALKVKPSFEIFAAPDKAAEPAIPHGSRMLCSASLRPQSGDFVVFVPNDGAAHFVRLYALQRDGSILLHAPNRSFDSYVSSQAELESNGRLLPVLRIERDFSALERAGSLPPFSRGSDASSLEPAGTDPAAAADADGAVSAEPAPDAAEGASALPQPKKKPEPAYNPDELLTFDEAKAALRVHRTKMYALLRSGELKALKVGKLWRIEKSSIFDYLRNSAFSSGRKSG